LRLWCGIKFILFTIAPPGTLGPCAGSGFGALAAAGAQLKLSFKLSFEVLRPSFTQCVRGEAAAEVFEAGEGCSMTAAQSVDAGA